MGGKISIETALRRYQVQAIELNKVRKKCIEGGGPDAMYTDIVTCQGTQPGRLSGKGHRKCGRGIPIQNAYKCLYCKYWFCATCAEKHFGKTRDQHNAEMAKGAG